MRPLLWLTATLSLASPIPQPEIQSWREASQNEELLRADPANDRLRSLLLGWYTRNYQDARATGPRLRHIFHAIEHSPSMFLIDSRSLRVAETEAAFPRARQAWLDAVTRLPADPIVRIRAAQTLMRSDRAPAARWLRQVIREAAKQEPLPNPPPPFGAAGPWWSWGYCTSEATRSLAQLLTDAITGITSRSPWEATGPIDPAVRLSGFALEAAGEIDRTNHATLLAESAWWLHLTSESFERDGRPDRSFVPMAWRWFQRLERMEADDFARNNYIDSFQRYWSRLLPQSIPAPLPRVKRSLAPLNALDPPCQDAVAITVGIIVAPDGRPRFIQFFGGPPWSTHPAVAAARRLRFAPGFDGRQPVEVETTVAVRVCPSP